MPLKLMFSRLNLTEGGQPKGAPLSPRSPVMLQPNCSAVQPRNPAIAAREFAARRHINRAGEDALADGIRGEGLLQSPETARVAAMQAIVGDGNRRGLTRKTKKSCS